MTQQNQQITSQKKKEPSRNIIEINLALSGVFGDILENKANQILNTRMAVLKKLEKKNLNQKALQQEISNFLDKNPIPFQRGSERQLNEKRVLEMKRRSQGRVMKRNELLLKKQIKGLRRLREKLFVRKVDQQQPLI